MNRLGKLKIIFASLVVVIIIVGLLVLLKNSSRKENYGQPFSFKNIFGKQEQKQEETNALSQKSILESQGGSMSESGDHQLYINKKHKFSLEIPSGWIVTQFPEGDTGETILVKEKSPENPQNEKSFQIFVAPFDEPGPITKERILQDIPEMQIIQPQQTTIGGEQSLVFFSKNSPSTQTREVWFVHQGFVYQVTAPAEFDETLAKIMITFKFQ